VEKWCDFVLVAPDRTIEASVQRLAKVDGQRERKLTEWSRDEVKRNLARTDCTATNSQSWRVELPKRESRKKCPSGASRGMFSRIGGHAPSSYWTYAAYGAASKNTRS